MSQAGRVAYNFVQGSSLEELQAQAQPLQLTGWEAASAPRTVEIKVPGRGIKVCYSQTFVRFMVTKPRCAKVEPGDGATGSQPRSRCEHFVQVYATDAELLDELEEYVAGALTQGEAAVVIATQEHVDALDERLGAAGIDLSQKRFFGCYITIDAMSLLRTFMVDGLPDENLFKQKIIPVLDAARSGGRQVRAFGEMVALLWAEGKRAAALKLEALWHPICEKEQFPLFCAYPKSGFASDNFAGLDVVCAAHSRVF